MTDLARDIAKELLRRQRRRRLLWFGAVAALAILAVLYLRCGSGWGTGGSGDGKGSGNAIADAGPHRCSIRVAASGFSVDGVVATREQAVARCAKAGGADVLVTGDARQGDWDELRAALEAARIPVFLRR
jgi:hypothetical protein